MDGQTDGGDYNIPFAFLKKRGDKNLISQPKHMLWWLLKSDPKEPFEHPKYMFKLMG